MWNDIGFVAFPSKFHPRPPPVTTTGPAALSAMVVGRAAWKGRHGRAAKSAFYVIEPARSALLLPCLLTRVCVRVSVRPNIGHARICSRSLSLRPTSLQARHKDLWLFCLTGKLLLRRGGRNPIGSNRRKSVGSIGRPIPTRGTIPTRVTVCVPVLPLQLAACVLQLPLCRGHSTTLIHFLLH